ncbi:hypothetical protein MVA48_08785 [Blastococcus sp. PRF04-17]|nr:hypothetical protein MVA48_08785 [Blastococcus sp. PRF04-17]
MTTNLTTRRRSATTIVAAIGAVGAAAAVAGMATFGDFTDSTSPVNTNVDTGVVSIDLSDGGSGSVPFTGGLMLAGDSRSHLVDLVNDGNTALGRVSLTSWATSPSVLDSDTVNGLQLKVESCSVPWEVSDTSPVCTGTVRTHTDGPIVVTDVALAGSAALTPGSVDHLKLTASLPVTATGDDFQGATSSLSFQFTGTQKTGSAR